MQKLYIFLFTFYIMTIEGFGEIDSKGVFCETPKNFIAHNGRHLVYSFLCEIKKIFAIQGHSFLEEKITDHAPFFVDGMTYDITYTKGYRHAWGNGGKSQECYTLRKEGEPILVTYHTDQWGTYSDDSTDYELPSDDATYLLREDSVARTLFDNLVEKHD